MLLSNKQLLLLTFVQQKHGEQKRKYTGEPYWHHVYAVAEIVSEFDGTAIEIALGHDLLEDTNCTYAELLSFLVNIGYDLFEAKNISYGIEELTDKYTHADYPEMNRKARKQKEAERLWKISARSQTVKYGGIINNTLSITENDKGFAKVYLEEIAETLSGMQNGNPQLLEQCKSIVSEAISKLSGNEQLNLFGNALPPALTTKAGSVTEKEKPELKLPQEQKELPGILWCTACEETPGRKQYIDFAGKYRDIPCPICKGTRQYTYKGKSPVKK